jgi:flavin reductase (DIM6/NTAB) family NADH-FMN oxidoreductase RutF
MEKDVSRSGGGIVHGGTAGSGPPATEDAAGAMRMMRRRWASGVVIVLTATRDGGFRGITATSFMVVSEEPPLLAIAVRNDGEFAALLEQGAELTVSLLESEHEFVAERFAGRAPLPDRLLTGIKHGIDGDLPIMADALGWCRGAITQILPAGDHILVIVQVLRGGAGVDTDDPLLRYEGRYRRLEAG